jgi:pimeloyl-ACP methyl ester carboxylesterase
MTKPTIVFFAGLLVSGCEPFGGQSRTVDEHSDPRFAETYVSTSDGLRLYARSVGDGPDTVIIPAAAYLARDLLPLATGRTLIFYDPRGRGASDVPADSQRLGIEFDIADLETVRAHFAVGRVSLIGFSYLGAVVALYAAEFPQYVDRAVQIGPMAPRTETSVVTDQRGATPNPDDLTYLADLREAGRPGADPVGYCREWLMRQLLPSSMNKLEGLHRTRMDPCVHWNEWPDQVFRTLRLVLPREWDFSDRAQLVRAPVLTVHGTQDRNAPIEGGRDWVTLIPSARLVVLEDVGHLPWLEEPERFFAEVDTFLRR